MSNQGNQQRHTANGDEEQASSALESKDVSNKVPHLPGSCGRY